MVHFLKSAPGLVALSIFSAAPVVATEVGQNRIDTIEVAFVLDTTGSMSGLIDGAKKKIWSIADEIRKTNGNATIRFALIGYRDRGDDYITDVHDLTDDLYGLYGKLIAYQADGGGDWPESVNEALNVAVTRLDWTEGNRARRVVFLVGDAPPHMDYNQDVAFTVSAKIANERGIIVNAVQAGDATDTEVAWRSIAALGKGTYMAIPQSGNVKVVETPYDNQIRELQLKLDLTVVPYGSDAERLRAQGTLSMKSVAPAPTQADMAGFLNRGDTAPGKRKVVTGSLDLVEEFANGRLKLDEVSSESLPEPLQTLSPEEREKAIKEKAEERAKLQAEIDKLVADRDAFLLKAEAEAAPKDSFDRAVKETMAEQLK